LSDAIQAGGVPCALSEAIEKDLWAKVLYNSLLNPLGALVGVPYGALGEREETRAIMEAIAEETFRVMHVAGYSSHWDSPSEYLDTFYEQLLPPTAEHQSSMLQDLHAGRPTEIDQLCGAICTLAEKHGIEAPLNRALHTLIRVAEQRH
jgi:2-dehydropantoate 2-reductase